MFYGRQVRRQNDLQLRTLPTHFECNEGFRLDEEYFVYALAPIALESLAAEAVVGDIATRLHEELRNEALVSLTLGEFEKTPSGLELPGGKIAKRLDGKRVDRVHWKVVRALHFIRSGGVLSDRRHSCQIFGPEDEPWVEHRAVLDTQSLGDYPSIFDYKRLVVTDGKATLEMWGLLFWDQIIGIVMFHAMACCCDEGDAH
jgi:hypothetical protein